MNDTEKGRIIVFYSYAHSDEALRKRLEKSLSSLRKEGLISEWHDRKIRAGDVWEDEIDKYLDRAKIVLFLVICKIVLGKVVLSLESLVLDYHVCLQGQCFL